PTTRRWTAPPSPFFPWHTAHFLAKISAPSVAVPRPGGSSFPSGPTMKSKILISSWVRGVPRLVRDCASPATGAARIITGTSKLREHLRKHGIVYAPIAIHPPGLNGIDVNGAAGFLLSHVGDAPVFIQLRQCRLNFTAFIRAARLEHRLFSVPSPVQSKPGMRLRKHRCLKLCVLPTAAAVG